MQNLFSFGAEKAGENPEAWGRDLESFRIDTDAARWMFCGAVSMAILTATRARLHAGLFLQTASGRIVSRGSLLIQTAKRGSPA